MLVVATTTPGVKTDAKLESSFSQCWIDLSSGMLVTADMEHIYI